MTSKIIVSRDVIFHENSRWAWDTSNGEPMMTVGDSTANEDEEKNNSCEESEQEEALGSGRQSSTRDSTSRENSRMASTDESHPRRTRLLTDIYNSCTFALHVANPQEYQDAVRHKEWQEAMDVEFVAIQNNRTWDLPELLPEKKVVGLKWVYKTKFGANGEIQKHKARLVAKGYVQQHGLDYEEVFSPVARLETVRIILALAAQAHYPIYHFGEIALFQW